VTGDKLHTKDPPYKTQSSRRNWHPALLEFCTFCN